MFLGIKNTYKMYFNFTTLSFIEKMCLNSMYLKLLKNVVNILLRISLENVYLLIDYFNI